MTTNNQSHNILGLKYFKPEGIPQLFKDMQRWGVFELVYTDETLTVSAKPKKPTRAPSGKSFSTDIPAEWMTFDNALAYAIKKREGKLASVLKHITYVPALIVPRSWYIVDLDNHENNPDIEATHEALIAATAGAYVETSISGAGQHIAIPMAWTGATSKEKDDLIDIKIQKTDMFLLMTGNTLPGNGNLFTAVEWHRAIEKFFVEAGAPDIEGQEFEQDEDLGPECDQGFIDSLAPNTLWAMTHWPKEIAPPTIGVSNDGSERISRVLKDLLKVTRNFKTTRRIFLNSRCAEYEGRTEGRHGKETELAYTKWLDRVADSVVKEMLKDGTAGKTVFALDFNKEQLKNAGTSVSSNSFDTTEELASSQTFMDTAPSGFQWLLTEILNNIDPGKRIIDYAIGVALNMLSNCAGRKYVCPIEGHDNYLCTNIVLVGGSSIGKSLYTEMFPEIQSSMIDTSPLSLLRIPRKQTFATRTFAEMMSNPTYHSVQLFYPEFGLALGSGLKMNPNNPDNFQKALMDASTKRKLGGILTGIERANKDNDVKTVRNPCYSILGDSTKELILTNTTRTDFNSGFLARFLFIPNYERAEFEAPAKVNRRKVRKSNKLSPELLERLERIAFVPAPVGSMLKPEPITIYDESDDDDFVYEYQCKIMELRKHYQDDEMGSAFFGRMGEYVFNIAALIGLIDNPDEPVMTRNNIEWAYRYVVRCISAWVNQTAKKMAPMETAEEVTDSILRAYRDVLGTYTSKGMNGIKLGYNATVVEALREPHLQMNGMSIYAIRQSLGTFKKMYSFDMVAHNKVIAGMLEDLVNRDYLVMQEYAPPRGRKAIVYCLTDEGFERAKRLK